jgi:hypothetical protein
MMTTRMTTTMDKSPERNMRESLKDQHGRYMAYATCERCGKRPSAGLTILTFFADGTCDWEGYACKPCKQALKKKAIASGGTFED